MHGILIAEFCPLAFFGFYMDQIFTPVIVRTILNRYIDLFCFRSIHIFYSAADRIGFAHLKLSGHILRRPRTGGLTSACLQDITTFSAVIFNRFQRYLCLARRRTPARSITGLKITVCNKLDSFRHCFCGGRFLAFQIRCDILCRLICDHRFFYRSFVSVKNSVRRIIIEFIGFDDGFLCTSRYR